MIGVRWLGHASVVIDLAGSRFLTDPLLLRHAGLLRRATAPPEKAHWAGTDAVLLSHLHHDHAELASLRMLALTPVFASAAVAAWLRRRGHAGVAIGEEWITYQQCQVRLVPAEHHSRRMPHRPNEAHGFLLRGDGRRIWFAGDTGAYPELERLPEWAEGPIDLALLPIHGWGPRLSAGHLDPPGAAEVCRRVGVRTVLPIHHGTLYPVVLTGTPRSWMSEPGQAFAAAVGQLSPDTTVLALTPGEAAIV